MAITLVPAASGAIVFDNFDSGGGFHPTDNIVAASEYQGSYIRAAAQFTVSGNDFSLTSVTLPISFAGGAGWDNFQVRLTADSGGAPGVTLEVLSLNEFIWPDFSNPFSTATTLTSAANPTLSNGASYWIVTELTETLGVPHDFRWFYNTSGTTVLVRQQQSVTGLPTDPWTGFSGQIQTAFRVEGTSVPEPSTFVLVGLGLVNMGVVALRKKYRRA